MKVGLWFKCKDLPDMMLCLYEQYHEDMCNTAEVIKKKQFVPILRDGRTEGRKDRHTDIRMDRQGVSNIAPTTLWWGYNNARIQKQREGRERNTCLIQ